MAVSNFRQSKYDLCRLYNVVHNNEATGDEVERDGGGRTTVICKFKSWLTIWMAKRKRAQAKTAVYHARTGIRTVKFHYLQRSKLHACSKVLDTSHAELFYRGAAFAQRDVEDQIAGSAPVSIPRPLVG